MFALRSFEGNGGRFRGGLIEGIGGGHVQTQSSDPHLFFSDTGGSSVESNYVALLATLQVDHSLTFSLCEMLLLFFVGVDRKKTRRRGKRRGIEWDGCKLIPCFYPWCVCVCVRAGVNVCAYVCV